MPQWIHNRAEHILGKNPKMPKSQAFAIATQQAHAAGKSPKGYGTTEGRREAKKKYDAPASSYEQTADPGRKSKTSSVMAFLMEFTDPSPSTSDGDAKMKNKLAGHQPLQDAIQNVLSEAREKMKLAAEGGDKEKVKKLVSYEKKEHGHIPTEKEEKEECKDKASSVIDIHDPDEVEKLAAALDVVAEKVASDSIANGNEAKQGGEQLPTQGPAGGKQMVAKGGSKHAVPMHPGSEKPSDAKASPANAVATDEHHTPGGKGAKYPPNGVLRKTGGIAAIQSVVEKTAFSLTEEGHEHDAEKAKHKGEYYTKRTEALQKRKAVGYLDPDSHRNPAKIMNAIRFGDGVDPRHEARHQAYVEKKHREGSNAWNPWGGAFTPTKHEKGGTSGSGLRLIDPSYYGKVGKHDTAKKEKKSAAKPADPVSYILDKISAAHLGNEAKQGGETLANTAPVPSNPGRQLIANNAAPKNATRPEAKAPRKAELAEVLTEPDNKHGQNEYIKKNLRSSAKGGVKTAAARALLAKIAEEGCSCSDAGTCRHCKMKAKTSSIKVEAKKSAQA